MKAKAKNWFDKLREHPIIYTLCLIVGVYLVVALVAYIVMSFATRHGNELLVPDFSGKDYVEASHQAKKEGLKIIVNDSLFVPTYPAGVILEQLPKGGVAVKKGRKVYITINSLHQKRVTLPYVAGQSLRQAKNMLENAGMEIRELQYVADIATNYVLSQYVGNTEITATSNIQIEKGSGITLVVGVAEGENSATVPSTIGRQLFEAKNRLWENGFNVGQIIYDADIPFTERNNARVYRQSLNHGTMTTLGTVISLYLTTSREKIAEGEKTANEQTQRIMAEQSALENEPTEQLIEQPTEQSGETTEEDNFLL